MMYGVWFLAGMAVGAAGMLLAVRQAIRSDKFGDRLVRGLEDDGWRAS